jgi:PDZ domain
MRTNQPMMPGRVRALILAAALLPAGPALYTALAADASRERATTTTASAFAEASDPPDPPPANQKEVLIRSIELDGGKPAAKELAWLGVYAEDVPEALAAQLDLKGGQGLLVNYVAPDSPAARAGLRKNDVLVELDGQILVAPVQLRKLVQMRADGDTVKLTFYRGGKPQAAAATLVKKKWNEGPMDENASLADSRMLQLHSLPDTSGLGEEINRLVAQSLATAGLDKEKLKLEIQHSIEQGRKAIQDAVQHSHNLQDSHQTLESLSKELTRLAGSGVDVGKDATVIIKSHGKSARTIVETGDSGSYVIVADPEKHLTAHDKHGRLLFDGAIETPAEQKKVPQEIWERIKPLLEQMDKGTMEIEQPPLRKDPPEEGQKP